MPPVKSPKRGAIPSPRSVLAAATPHVPSVGAPPNFIVVPPKLSMWGNDVHGDCVTAEEAFAKSCSNPEIFIPEVDVIAWATRHGVLEGASLTPVMTWMQNDGFAESPFVYDDGPHFSVNWTDAAILQSAISKGPVKLGIGADQLETAWHTTGGKSGWFATGFHADSAEDHSVSLCGYGTISWLAQQLHVPVPSGIDGAKPGYAMFTWSSIGIIDAPSMTAITHEAWFRQPTTVTKSTGQWGGFEDLGGVITSEISVAAWSANRLDCFARGTDNAMYHKWWDGSKWGGWESLGGVILEKPTVVSWGANRLDCFARGTDHAMYHKWWDGSKWGGWESLGGVLTGAISAVSWGANRLDCFARGTDNAMYHKWWDGSKWGGWESLGGVLVGGISAVSWGANRLDCFGRGTDNAMYHKWWDGSKWGGWESLGGILLSDVSAVSWGANRLDCFGRGTDSAAYHKWWDGSQWGGWESLGGVIMDKVTPLAWGANRLDCFARGTDNAMYHKWWDGSQWGGWETLGGTLLADVAGATWARNRLDLFGQGTDSAMYHKWWG